MVATKKKPGVKLAIDLYTPAQLADVGLMVANKQGTRGKWHFHTAKDSWQAELSGALGKFKVLLAGVKRFRMAEDNRLCLCAPNAQAQQELFGALRNVPGLHVCNMLTPAQLAARKYARQFATKHGVRIVQWGTRVGLCGPRAAVTPHLPTISLNTPRPFLLTSLQRLLAVCSEGAPPPQRRATPPPRRAPPARSSQWYPMPLPPPPRVYEQPPPPPPRRPRQVTTAAPAQQPPATRAAAYVPPVLVWDARSESWLRI